MTGVDSAQVDKLAAGDRPGLESVLTLMQLIQPHLTRSLELLAWQYFETPAGPGHIYTLKKGNVLAAVYCAATQRICVGDASFQGWMVQDVMTHPDHRGSGYLHHLAAACLDELKQSGGVGYTFPNEQSQRSFRRSGWTELCVVPRRAQALKDFVAPPDAGVPIEAAATFGLAASRVWRASRLAIGVVRESEFLNWRYGKPGQQYLRFMVDGDKGVLVLKLFQGETAPTVHICDLFVDAAVPDIVSGAIRFAQRFALSQGADQLTAWVGREHPYASQFEAAGIHLVESADRFVFVTSPAAVDAECSDAKNWHFSQGDSDVY